MTTGRPATRQGRPMKQKSIDFRELLERLLPLDELPPASRLEVHRALKAGVISQLERAALLALGQLEQTGVVKRLPPAPGAAGPMLRYRAPNHLDVISIELPATRERGGIAVIPRSTLPVRALADLQPVRRLLSLDDTLVADPGPSRHWLLEQLGQVGREFLAASEVLFVPLVANGSGGAEPLDRALAIEVLAEPNAVFYCADTALAPRLERAAMARGARAVALVTVVAGDGRALGHLEVLSHEPDPFQPEDLALVALLADTVAGLLERATRIEKLVFVDPLTGAYNRSYFDLQVQVEMARGQREASSMALLLADIDDFKAFNTTYGYEAGNQVLVQVAGALRGAVRPFDIVVRWGGEEFVVLLTAPVAPEDAEAISERLRATVERLEVAFEGLDRRTHGAGVTVSVGVALFPDHAPDAQELWRAANRALLVAKQPPKNRVVFYEGNG